MSVIDSLFTKNFQEGRSYGYPTLPEQASIFIADLESLLGQRDKSFTLVGIVIDTTPNSLPRLWYPPSGYAADEPEKGYKHIIIRLGPDALTHRVRARWQLAHECFHLMDPHNVTADGPTNWLEEGLATWYQNSRVPEAESHPDPYAQAEDLVKSLTEELPNVLKLIRKERKVPIGKVTPTILRDYCPSMTEETARGLCKPFS